MFDRDLSLWAHIKNFIFSYLGIGPRVVNHVLGAMNEVDNSTPSSARTYGGMLFIGALGLQVAIMWVLLRKLALLDMAHPNAPLLLPVLTKVILVFLLWSLLFDVATALSLYGINVWRYVAAIRTGGRVEDDHEPHLPTVSEIVTDVRTEAATPGPQVIPPPGRVD